MKFRLLEAVLVEEKTLVISSIVKRSGSLKYPSASFIFIRLLYHKGSLFSSECYILFHCVQQMARNCVELCQIGSVQWPLDTTIGFIHSENMKNQGQ